MCKTCSQLGPQQEMEKRKLHFYSLHTGQYIKFFIRPAEIYTLRKLVRNTLKHATVAQNLYTLNTKSILFSEQTATIHLHTINRLTSAMKTWKVFSVRKGLDF